LPVKSMVLQMRKWKVMPQPRDWYWYDVGRHLRLESPRMARVMGLTPYLSKMRWCPE
jgi:hypothetical protein